MKELFILTAALFFGCKNCDKIGQFTSYDNAIEQVRSAHFAYSRSYSPRSSWINEFEYYSCDKSTGFLIVSLENNKEYIYEGVPLSVWQELKDAKSAGSFYDNGIKGRYILSLH